MRSNPYIHRHPTISIVLCTFNGEKYIEQLLDSIAKQTNIPDEIIISDDLSNDKTPKIINKFLNKNTNMQIKTYMTDYNMHFTGHFLWAASKATSEYIAFCDQDDIWMPEKIDICRGILAESDADLLIHKASIIGPDGEQLPVPDRPLMAHPLGLPARIPWADYNLGCCFVIRRSVLEEFLRSWDWEEHRKFRQHFGAPIGHDLLLFMYCLGMYRIQTLPTPLIRYRVHDSNVTAVRVDGGSAGKIMRYMQRINFQPEKYAGSAIKWKAEVDLLQMMLSRTPDRNGSLGILETHLTRKSYLWALRAKVYDGAFSLTHRLSAFRRLLLSGAYGLASREFGMGPRSLPKDVLALGLAPFTARKRQAV